jgi:predicted phosphatase
MKILDKFVIQQRLNHIRENPCWLYVDIDDTLLMHDDKIEIPDKTRIKMKLLGKDYYFIENTQNVETIKEMHKKGFVCVAWSAAGKKWAQQAVKALKLEKYFSHVLTKPMYYLDDKDPSSYMGKNLYRPHK